MSKSNTTGLIISLVLISILYYISSCYINTSNDGSHYALVSAIVNKQTVVIADYIKYTGLTDYALKNGQYYSDRLPGNAILMIPFFLFGNLLNTLHLSQISSHVPIQEVTVILLPNICCVIGILFIYKLFLFFKFSHTRSLLLSVIFAVCTLTWQEATHVFSHAPSMTFVWIAIYFLIKAQTTNSKHYYIFVALLSYASIIELQNCLLFIPCAIYIISSKKVNELSYQQNIKTLLYTVTIFLGSISILVAYNYIAFDEIMLKSNKYNPEFPEEISFLSSLSGNFFLGLDTLFTNFTNPEVYFNLEEGTKNLIPGLFITSPVLILSLAGFYFFIKKFPKEGVLFITIIIINVLIAACHQTVLVRHIFTITPFLFFPIVFLTGAIKNKKIQMLYFSVLILFALISIYRVFYAIHTYWGRELTNLFPFTKELGVYLYFLIFAGIITALTKIIFLRKKPKLGYNA